MSEGIENFVQTVTLQALTADSDRIELANPGLDSPFNLPFDGCSYVLLMERESVPGGGCRPKKTEIIKYDGFEDDGVTLKIVERGVGDTESQDWTIGAVVQQPFLAEHYQCVLEQVDGLGASALYNMRRSLELYAMLLDQDKKLAAFQSDVLGNYSTLSKSVHELDKVLSGATEDVAALKENQEQLTFASWSQFEYTTQINRHNEQSGVKRARAYERTGARAFHKPTSTNYAPYGGHSHSNFKNLVGTAEFSWNANGVFGVSRHNDDGLYAACQVGDDFDNRQLIEAPGMPADVASAQTATEKIELVKQYIRVMAGELPASAVGDFQNAAQWVFTGIEVFPEVYRPGESLRDTFPGHRHQNSAETLPGMFREQGFYNATGHKNIRENTVGIAMAVDDIDDQGKPIVVLWRYRFIHSPVGRLADYPIAELLEYRPDNVNEKAWQYSREQMLATRLARFKVKQRLGHPDSDRFFNRPSLVDELVHGVAGDPTRPGFAGLNGQGNTLEEDYFYYGANDRLKEYGTNDPLRAGYYNRWFSMNETDASGRRNALRFFTSDDNCFVAITDNPRIRQQNFGAKKYGASYLFLLEAHLQSFLNGNCNVYGVPDMTAQYNYTQVRQMLAAGVGRSKDNPFPGYSERGAFYVTPAELLSPPADADFDMADTVERGGVWMMCADGEARLHVASGYGYFLPTNGVTERPLRLRYPIYESAFEGTEAFKYIEAAREDQCSLVASQFYSMRQSLRAEARINELAQA